ncbi:hypothetical protein [Adhaeribacter radiodurans]|uniref:RHS repeat protein n=1 Tax=Adhaeribacter radiodurans TaxID=2745197 RepID=A0A7L7L815_9BACT|nr:hypothetical protein [Adhaeribacter radiodurans]QMU28938.1 hypothetical protein HUW48_13210 [Adhaeribacter radiodurans]
MKTKLHILIVLVMVACNNQHESYDPWLPEGIKYSYSITTYYGENNDLDNHRGIEYYDSLNRILLKVSPEEGCTKYEYDSIGRLQEERWGRNCQFVSRLIMVYDKAGNHLGVFSTQDSTVNIIPAPFRQTKFYDSENRLIKELTRDHTDADGKKNEEWKELRYSDGRISKEIITWNGSLEWVGIYEYDKYNRLVAIKRRRGQVTQNKYFRYNKQGKVIEEKRTSNEYPISTNATHYAWNSSTLYEYDSTGSLVKVFSLTHKGDMDLISRFVKKYNKP